MISVIVPVYNGAKYLDECLSSVPNSDTEIIVVNDGSPDNSQKIIDNMSKNQLEYERVLKLNEQLRQELIRTNC